MSDELVLPLMLVSVATLALNLVALLVA